MTLMIKCEAHHIKHHPSREKFDGKNAWLPLFIDLGGRSIPYSLRKLGSCS